LAVVLFAASFAAMAAERVVDSPTSPGVSHRLLVESSAHPRAAAILFAGGHGGLQIQADGGIGRGRNNFLVRSRHKFAERGPSVDLIDAPSDRQSPPYLQRFRDTAEHVADVRAVIAWIRQEANVPVWVVGTSTHLRWCLRKRDEPPNAFGFWAKILRRLPGDNGSR
jgi:hypothetical protein